jgi:branched-subunit amino acid ABC-type transport system permease component
MEKLLQVLIIGVLGGAVYGFIAIGMVLVYRTTGVLNIAHGGIGVLSAYIAWDLITLRGVPYYIGIAVGILFAGALGLFFEWAVVQRLAGQPALQTGATLGLYVLLQGVTFMPPWWTNNVFQVLPSPLLNKGVKASFANDQYINYDQILLIGSLALCSIALYWMLRRTRIGLAMRAISDDPSAAPLMGIRHQLVSRTVWTMSFCLSALTTMLLAPILLLDNISLTLLTVKALTVAFIGALVSLPLTIAGALVLGAAESASDIYWGDLAWLKHCWPFALMVLVLVVRATKGRKTILDDAPAVAA